jgi:hypothetical protein
MDFIAPQDDGRQGLVHCINRGAQTEVKLTKVSVGWGGFVHDTHKYNIRVYRYYDNMAI